MIVPNNYIYIYIYIYILNYQYIYICISYIHAESWRLRGQCLLFFMFILFTMYLIYDCNLVVARTATCARLWLRTAPLRTCGLTCVIHNIRDGVNGP